VSDSSSSNGSGSSNGKNKDEEEVIVPRDYTLSQLAIYDGSDEDKPILIALKGDVYDVSSASDLYGRIEGMCVCVCVCVCVCM
jgi:hypothetical protein